MKVYLVQRLSLLGLVVCCLQMGSMNAEKLPQSIENMQKKIKHPQNKKLLTSINYNIDSPDRGDTASAATYNGMLLIDTEGIIKNLFPKIGSQSLERAAEMRDLLLDFNEATFQQFPANMQVAFVSIVNRLAELPNASDKIKLLATKLKSMPIAEPAD